MQTSKRVQVQYDQLKLINAAKYLAKYNNIGTKNQNRSVDDWYQDILNNIKRAAKEKFDIFSTGGYTLNLEIDSFDSYHVDITVSPSFGDIILKSTEVYIQ